MRISREVIEAKPRKLDTTWNLEYEEPCVLHGKEFDELFFIKNFVPWAKTPADGQTIFAWACTRLMSNEIRKEIDKEIVEVLTKLK